MGIKKSHSAVSSTSAEAGAVLGEDSCRKDIQDGGVFFYGRLYSVKGMGVYKSTAATPGHTIQGGGER